jgi:hypothetical protein
MGVAEARSASGATAPEAPPRSYAQIMEDRKAEPAVGAASSARPSLGVGTQLAYSFLRMPLSSLDFTFRPARMAIWVDTLGQSLSSQASLISLVKSVDLLLGFSVGKASDSLRSPYGRRKPFIFVLFPVSLLAFLAFVNAASLGLARPGTGREQPCTSLVRNATAADGCNDSRRCPALFVCVGAASTSVFYFSARASPVRHVGLQLSHIELSSPTSHLVQVPRAACMPRRRHRRRSPRRPQPHHARPRSAAKNGRTARQHSFRAALLRLPRVLRHRIHGERITPTIHFKHAGAIALRTSLGRAGSPHVQPESARGRVLASLSIPHEKIREPSRAADACRITRPPCSRSPLFGFCLSLASLPSLAPPPIFGP